MCQFYMDNTNITTHSWRDKRYRHFYEVVDSIIDELQDARPEKGGKALSTMMDLPLFISTSNQ